MSKTFDSGPQEIGLAVGMLGSWLQMWSRSQHPQLQFVSREGLIRALTIQVKSA